MKRKTIFLILVVIIGALSLINMNKISKKEAADVVFLGDKKYKETFDHATKSGKVFSDLFNTALNRKNVGDYENAIKLLNECLPHAALGPEVAMVYKQLSEIYRAQGNLEKELFYTEELPKYTMSDAIKKDNADRASEIRQLLTARARQEATT